MSDLGLNLRLKLSKNYTFSMSSSFKTYGYKFDKNGNVVPNDRTEWSYGRFGIFQGYGSSFSYTFNNDTWKKWKEKLSGTGDSDKEKKTKRPLKKERARKTVPMIPVFLRRKLKKPLSIPTAIRYSKCRGL